uniref:Mos1 transposase HTH domain-containing protein n=1 Tax=Romanomermis culicivorax TaxID=13658 RepID=A0A915J9X9_ROMCU
MYENKKFEHRAVIKFLTNFGKNDKQIYADLRKVYGDPALPYSTVARWESGFNIGRQSLKDDSRSGRPSTAINEETTTKLGQIVKEIWLTCKPSINFARMKWGICAPKSCNTRNMTVLFRYMIFPTKHFCNVTVACRSESEANRDAFFIGTMFIFACVAAVVFLGTLYDVLFYQAVVENLEEEKYRVIKNEEFEPNGANNLVLNMGKSRKEYYDELHWALKLGLAFSAYSNSKRILDTDENPQEFIIIHALRSLCTIWATVILSNIFIISYIGE